MKEEGRMNAGSSGRKMFFILLSSFLFLFASVVFVGAAEVTLTDVQSAFLEKDYPKTKKLAQAFASQTSSLKEKMEALYYSGLSDLWLGEYMSARRSLEEVLKGKVDKALRDKASLGVIDTYYMEGDYKKSLKLAEDLLSESSRSGSLSSIYLKIARSHLKLAHWKKGREYLELIVEKFPQSLERYHVDQLLQESQFFAVQVGSFQDRAKAEASVAELQERDEYAYIVETTSPDGKKFYRVRVGKFQQFDEAQKLEVKLSQIGYPTKIYP